MLMPSRGEVVRLKAGGSVTGDIVFQNDEVVVVRDSNGARFQYLMSEVEGIYSEEQTVEQEERQAASGHKVTVAVSVGGGGAVVPGEQSGGALLADVAIGTRQVFGKPLFLGGAFGYHALFMHDAAGVEHGTYSFLALRFRAEVPLTATKHAPVLGIGIGYGISAVKQVKGGLFSELQTGWRGTTKSDKAVALTVFADFQRAKLTNTEYIDDVPYQSTGFRTFIAFGAKAGVYF